MTITKYITDPLRRLANAIKKTDKTKEFTQAPAEGTAEVQHIAEAYNRLMQDLQAERANLETCVAQRADAFENAKLEKEQLITENRQLIAAMNRTLEEERRSIAREIHDQLNAVTVAVRLGLQRVQKRLDKPDNVAVAINDVRAQLAECIDMVAHSYSIARQIIHRLRPEVIDALGLRGAIEDMVTNYNRIHPSCQFVLTVAGKVNEIGDEASIAIYRIVQEALTNAVKYAAATRVNTTIRREDCEGASVISIAVEDNGQGFDTSIATQGIGLLSMRERALAAGGEVRIQSRIGGGTRISATIPIALANHPIHRGIV